MNMDNQTLNYLPLCQSDPFGNSNEGMIGDFLGGFCNPLEISPLTLLNSQISENFPISGGIIFPPYRELGQESNKSSLLDPDSVLAASHRAQTTISNSRKRKSIPTGNGKDSPASSSLTASISKISGENDAFKAGKRSKLDEARSCKNGEDKPPEPLKDYIHVRARSGQATDSHSLAERARREKISERMTLLQDLVPGCNRITGKAVMLDEIINYVQSLQRQVEFLSMKLATMNPRMEFNANVALSTEMIKPGESLRQSLYTIACLEQRHPSGYYSLAKNMPRYSDTDFSSTDGFVQIETPGLWENDLQSIVQMSFGDIHQQSNNNGFEPTLEMKLEP